MPQVNVGDTVLYVPDTCHQHDKGKVGFCFEFVHVEDGPPRNGQPFGRKGEVVTPEQFEQFVKWWRVPEGHLKTQSGHQVRPTKPKCPWPAVVREVFEDGTLALDVSHPHGGITLHYPSRGATTGLSFDATGQTPHTWHEKGA